MFTGTGPRLVGAVILSAGIAAGCGAMNPRLTPGLPRLYGRVVGPDDAPLDGVRITTEPQTDAVLSFDGNYEISRTVRTQTPLAPGRYQLVPYKLGWWRGRNAPPITVDYPGQQYRVPDIRLLPIDGPQLDEVAVPEDVDEDTDPSGVGVVRGGE